MQNNLIAKGLRLITPDHAPVHVSGHACEEEIAELYRMVQPHLSVPVHGEARHQAEHTRIAKANGAAHVLAPQNGQLVRLGPGVHEVVAEVPCGRWGLDGKVLRRLDNGVAKDRKKMGYNGVAVVTVAMDAKGRVLADPQISLMGLVEGAGATALQGDLSALAYDAIEALPKSSRIDNAAVRHAVAMAVRRHVNEVHGKKPVTDVHVVRV